MNDKYKKFGVEYMNKNVKEVIINGVIPGIFTAMLAIVYAMKSNGFFSIYFIISYILYLLTCYKRMPKPDRVLPFYLLAVGLQLIHFAEEFITGFHVRIGTEIYNKTPYTDNMMVINQMSLFFLFIVGAIAIFKKWKPPMFIVWFVIIMMLFVNAIQHPIFAIMVKGYFPGLITSQFGWILGPILFKRLWEVRKYSDNLV